MKRVLTWAAIVVASIVVLATVAVYAVSERRLRQTFDIATTPVTIPTDSATLANGRHVFETRGCEGCHGKGLVGKVFFDQPRIARLIAPNVPKAITAYTDAELVRLLRHGIRPSGRGVAAMPSSMFYFLDDSDLHSLVAYLRTLPVIDGESLPATEMRVLARVGVVTGQYKLEPVSIVHDGPRPPKAAEGAPLGLYLAKSSCTECHGMELKGGMEREGNPTTPALSVVAGYSLPEFAKLMREGVPKDGRHLELMTPTAKNRFAHFSDAEVAGLYAYLSTLRS
jgi:mono/diheme cytochrome c family protein